MRRSLTTRVFSAVFGAWFAVLVGGAPAFAACPMGDAQQMGGGGHAAHMMMHGGAHRQSAPPSHHGAHHDCTCLGCCCVGSNGIVPSVVRVALTPTFVATPPIVGKRERTVIARVDQALPFATAPPSLTLV